ncbi:MAG: thioredoxin fold domain-containing protein [Flavobacteriaceae bacterium]
MKKITLLLLILFTVKITAQKNTNKINWISFEEALIAQKTNPKKIIMDVYTNWCGPCKLLDKQTFTNKNLVNYVNQNFYAVKFNGEGNEKITYQGQEFGNPNYDVAKEFKRNSSHQLANFLQIRAYPSILFFEEDGGLLAPLPGFRTAKQLEVFLKLFKTNKFKDINTEEAFIKYQKEFVYEF